MTAKNAFNKEFLATIRKSLEMEKVRIEKELSQFATKNPHVEDDYDANMPEYGNQEDENAREVADYTTNKPLEISLEKTLRDTIKSLERLDKGGYGICKYCDKPIDEKRLLARPTSGSCVACKKTLTQEV